MALVRCTCVATLTVGDTTPSLTVVVADPDCRYAGHRALAETVATPPAAC